MLDGEVLSACESACFISWCEKYEKKLQSYCFRSWFFWVWSLVKISML